MISEEINTGVFVAAESSGYVESFAELKPLPLVNCLRLIRLTARVRAGVSVIKA